MRIYDLVAGSYDDQIGPVSSREWQRGIVLLLKQAGLNRGVVIDIGCGTGSGAEMLSGIGVFIVDGVDRSIPMLEIAKRKNLYRNIYTETFPPLSCGNETYDLACCGFDTLNCLSPRQYSEFFECVRSRLKPGGWFGFDALVHGEYKHATIRETKHLSLHLRMLNTYGETFCTTKVTAEMPNGTVSSAQEKLFYANETELRSLLQASGFLMENSEEFSVVPDASLTKLVCLCRRY